MIPARTRLLLLGAAVTAVATLASWRPAHSARGPAAFAQDDDPEVELRGAARSAVSPKRELPALEASGMVEVPECWRSAPALWRSGPGRASLVSLEYRFGEGDFVICEELERSAEGWKVGRSLPVTARPGERFTPRGVRDSGGTDHVLYTENTADGSRLFHVRRTADGFAEPELVDALPGSVREFSVAAGSSGEIFVAAECQVPGSRDTTVQLLRRSAAEATVVRVDDATGSATEPALVAGKDARGDEILHVAYTRYRAGAADVVLRSFPASGPGAALRAVAADPNVDEQHPHLALLPDGTVLCAYDAIAYEQKATSDPRATSKANAHLGVRALAGDTLRSLGTAELGGDLLLPNGGGLPQLAIDAAGVPAILFRYLDEEGGRGALHSYPVVVQHFVEGHWTGPSWFSGSEGAPERVAACADEAGELVVAWHEDLRCLEPQSRLTLEPEQALHEALEARGELLTGTVGPATLAFGMLRAPSPGTEPVAPALDSLPALEVPMPPEDAAATAAFAPRHDTLSFGEDHYTLYYGDLHRHSSVSRCLQGMESRPEDAYRFARECCGLDFFSLTDHSGHTDPLQWWTARKLVARWTDPDFHPFLGYEWSTSQYGHQNVVLNGRPESIVSPAHPKARDPEGLWAQLPERSAITIPHHTAHARMATDWQHDDPRFLRLVEVYQSARGSFEAAGAFRSARTATAAGHFVRDGLDQGLRFGLIASSDHGVGASYAVALAERSDADSIFAALRARRTYATTTRGLLLDFRVEGAVMGSSVECEKAPRVELRVRGTAPIAEVQVFRDGRSCFGRGQVVGPAIPESIVLSLQWWNRRSTPRWKFRVEASAGRFEPVNDNDRRRERNQWTQESERVVRGEEENDGTIGSPIKRFRYTGPPSSKFHVTVQGTTYETSVRELLEGPLRASHGRSRWVLRILDAGAEVVDLEHDLGTTFEADFRDTRWQADDRSWYYARVIQTDGEIAWSSPIFVEPPAGKERDR